MFDEKTKFYICNTCGNLVTCLDEGGGQLVCCGVPMTELKANSTDGAFEKHVPYVTHDGSRTHILVGEAEHPKTESHYIKWIALKTDRTLHVKWLLPGQTPEASFVLGDDERPVAVYEYCNLHGLWVKEL